MKISSLCLYCGEAVLHYPSRPRKYCSQKCNNASGHAHRGKKHTPATIQKFKLIAEQKREAISKGWFKKNHKMWNHPNVKKHWIKPGTKPKNWLGGKQSPSEKIKNDPRYHKWRVAVFLRDKMTCQICGDKPKVIQADHIYSKYKYPEKVFDLDNGRTLCVPCHKKTPNYGAKAVTYENIPS